MVDRIRIATVWLIALFLVAGTAAWAGPPRIVVVETMPVPVVTEHSHWFLKGLEKLGYRDGETVVIERIEAMGDKDRAVQRIKEALKRGRPDMVATFATLASQAANEVLGGTDIPIVFSVVADPVGAGLIKTVGKTTETNITGLVYSLYRDTKLDFAGKLLTQPYPDRPVRIGVIHSSYPSSRGDIKTLRTKTQERNDLEFVPYEIEYREIPAGLDDMLAEVETIASSHAQEVDYWWILVGPLGEVSPFDDLLRSTGTPIGYCNTLSCVEKGGLFSVTPDSKEGGIQMARIADSIFKGKAPGSIPVLPPDRFRLGVNLKTAIDLGIVVPSEIMQLAGENIWR